MEAPKPVLVVGDDRNLLRVVQAGLEHAGCEVAIADDVRAAVAHLLSRHFGLLVLDDRLAHLDSVAVLPALRAAGSPSTRYVLLTSRDDQALHRAALAAGAERVYVKPFDLSALVSATRAALARPAGMLQRSLYEPGAPVWLRHPLPAAHATPGHVTGVTDDRVDIAMAAPVTGVTASAQVAGYIATVDGLYDFKARVVTADAAGTRIVLAKPGSLRRRQRRRHPRAPFPMAFDLLTSPSAADTDSGPPERAMGRDISLGGICLSTLASPGEGATVGVRLPSPPTVATPATIRAVVVRSYRAPLEADIAVSVLGLRFVDLRGRARAAVLTHLGSPAAV